MFSGIPKTSIQPGKNTGQDLSVLLADPALFTAPYDAALSKGLSANAVRTHWVTRQTRPGEEALLPAGNVTPLFYRFSDGPRRGHNGALKRAVKGVEHALGLDAVVRMARRVGFDALHFQWCVLPPLDLRAIRRLRESVPVILTVHDLVPFNGKNVSRLQRQGFDAVLRTVDHIIVHTAQGRQVLVESGVSASRISTIPHGMLPLAPPPCDTLSGTARARPRWRIVLFGRLQSYKGMDTLVEAAGLLPQQARDNIEITIAGEPMTPLEPVRARIAELGLTAVVRLAPRRFSEDEMALLLRNADCFVFPYRAIEASGVLHLVAGLGKWVIASDLGAFRDVIGADGRCGALVPVGDAKALATALTGSIGLVPEAPLGGDVPDWEEIGAATRAVYETAIARHAAEQRVAA